MSKVIVVTSGKGGVGKTTSTASIGAALAQTRQARLRRRFRRRPAQPRPRDGRGAPGRLRLHQRRPGRRQARAGADPRQADRYAASARRLADPRQGRADRRRRRAGHRRIARELRLRALRQPGGHRARRVAGDALRRSGDRRHQSRSLVGSRLRPHHRPSRFANPPRGDRRAHGQAIAADALRLRPLQPGRDAERRRRARYPLHPAAGHHPGERGHLARLEPRRAGDDEARRASPDAPIATPPAVCRRDRADGVPDEKKTLFNRLFGRRAA